MSARPPLPPNRACGSPAHGSPVGSFLIGIGSPAAGLRFPSASPWLVWRPCGTTQTLTPAAVTGDDRSPRLSHTHFPTFRLQPRDAPRHRFTRQYQRAGRVSDFAMNEQARRYIPPNQVRYPADRQFASSCSPPRLATTQLLSASGSWLAPARTSTVLCVRLHGRTHSGERRNPEN